MISRRKKFDYDFREKLMLYFGFLAPLVKCCSCSKHHHEEIVRVNKLFENAVSHLESECGII